MMFTWDYKYEKTCYKCKQTQTLGSDEELGPRMQDHKFYYGMRWLQITDSKSWLCPACQVGHVQPINYQI